MDQLFVYLFPAVLVAYLIWRSWACMKRLDPMPWELQLLLFIVVVLVLRGVGSLLSGLIPSQLSQRAISVIGLVLTFVITVAISLPFGKRYDAWRQEEKKKREHENSRFGTPQ